MTERGKIRNKIKIIKRRERSSFLLVGLIFLLAGSVICCGSPPSINYSPSSLEVSMVKEGSTTADQILSISNVGGGTLEWSLSSDVEWLTFNPTRGSSTGEVDEVMVSVDISGISVGSHSGAIIISTPGAHNSSQTIPVELVVESVWQEKLLQVNCVIGRWCEKTMSFTIEEHQEIQLEWFANGDVTFIAMFLEAPDGTCYEGHASRTGGCIDTLAPTASDSCHFWQNADGLFSYDLASCGIVNFYCSTTYDERSGSVLYPPGKYRLNFDVIAGWPYWEDKGKATETDITIKYRIE